MLKTRRSVAAVSLCVAVAAACMGCARSPMAMQGQVEQFQQQSLELAQKTRELQARADALDQDNQELEALLAQSRQQERIWEDQVAALRDQLSDTTSQLASVRQENTQVANEAKSMMASMRRRAGATITANNSLDDDLSSITLPGVQVRRDGDVIRVELPGDRLFAAGSAQLQAGANALIVAAATEISRSYPQQRIGVEGHTDSDPIMASQWKDNHQLSVGRAMAVRDILVSEARMRPNRVFTVGHGANHPIVSNATEAGKSRNRRVELVVYPEKISGP